MSQGRGDLDPEKTAYEEISQGVDSMQASTQFVCGEGLVCICWGEVFFVINAFT